jgi:Glycosyl transferase family 2
MALNIEASGASASPRLAVAAIFKNEGPYILEWVAFHRAVGIDRFFIADNGSDDGSTELLAALDLAGLVTHIPFPGTPGRPPQLPAYAEILRRHGQDADWIAFIDADEFLLPAAPLDSVRPVLAGLAARPEVGAVAVNWSVYGSAGEQDAREGLVIERFPARARHDTLVNHHYKTILRPEAFADVHETPHLFRLYGGFGAVHADGSPVEPYDGCQHGLSKAISWAPLRLNHYVVKSREEFFLRKRLRGRATQNAQRDAGFFAAHDRNEERDPMPSWLIEATRAEKRRLLERLRAAGWTGAEPALRPHPCSG